MKNETVLVVGSSGTVGSQLVKNLKLKGAQVRGTTSQNPQSTENVKLNLVTGEGLSEAFAGVDKAFFLSPPGYSDQYKLLSPLIQEAKKRGLKKVVLMTAMGANAVETSPFRRAELELERSGLPFNIIRPNWFYQNFNTFWIKGILDQKKILLPAGRAKVSFIDARDIADVAAELLSQNRFDNQEFDLTGSESIDHDQVAEGISKVSGKKVSYEEISPELFKNNLLSAGLPADYSDFLMMIFGFLREGYASSVNDHVQKITGHRARGLKDYVEAYAGSWK